MGSSHSTTEQVNKVVLSQEKTSKCTCSATSDNEIGGITVSCGPCCSCPLEVNQKAEASCDCDMKSAIESLAKMSDQMTAKTKSSFSFATSSSDSTQINETNVSQILTDTCNSTSTAKNYIGSIDINQTGSCCGATDAQIKAMAEAKHVFNQTASAQGKCLMSIAAKMSGDMDNKDENDTTTTDPLNAALSTITDGLTNMFGDLTQYLPFIAIGVVVVVVMMQIGKHHESAPPPPQGDERAEMAIYRGLATRGTRRQSVTIRRGPLCSAGQR